MPYIGRDLNRGNYLKLDDISSSFNGSTQTFNLTVGGSAFRPGSAFSILVSVGGVIQEPESAYQVNNSEITFANAPTAQDGFFCLALAVPIGIGVPGNGTVNGTQMAKPFNYDGFFYLDDANNRVGIGSSAPTVALDVDGVIKASSFTGGSGGINAGVVTCTGLDLNGNGDVSGNLVLGGNLTVNGTTTTLDTNLIGVDRIEVGANSSTVVGVAVTQSGTADILRLYDGSSQVVTVDDVGNVGLGSAIPSAKLDVNGQASFSKNITLPDSSDATDGRIKFGASTDMMMFHYGGANYIDVLNTLNIRGPSGGANIHIKPKQSHEGIKIIPDAQIELYHANDRIAQTLTNGFQIEHQTPIVQLYGENANASSSGYLNFNLRDGNSNNYNIARFIGQTDASNGGYGKILVQTAFNNTLCTRIQIDKDGKVQIGLPGSSTSLPGATEVVNIRAMAEGNLIIRNIGNLMSAPSGSGVGIDVLNNANNAVKDLCIRGAVVAFRSATAETLRITSGGNVYIGQTSGSEQLGVDGGSNSQTFSTNSTNSNGNYLQVKCSGNSKLFLGSAGSFITGNSGVTNQGIRAEGALQIATGGHDERLRIDSGGRVLIATTSGTQGQVNIFNATDFSTASISNTSDNIFLISDATSGDGVYGASIGFSRVQYADRRAAAIATVQQGSDEDNVGLAFFTHPSSNASDPVVEALRITSTGELTMTNAATKEFISVNTTNNSTRGTISMQGKDGSGNVVTLKMGGFGDTGRGEIFTHSNHGLGFATNNAATQMVLDTSGRLLLGTTSVGRAGADEFTIGNGSGDTGMTIRSGSSDEGNIYFSDSTSSGNGENRGIIRLDHSDDSMQFFTANGNNFSTEKLRITSGGKIGINLDDNTTADLQVCTPSSANGLLRIGGNNTSGVGIDIDYSNSGHTKTTFKQNYRASQATAEMSFESGFFTFITGTGSYEALRIKSDGTLGVNLTTPKTTRGIHISKGTSDGGIGNSYSLANEYLHFGFSEHNSSGNMGLFTMGFGYVAGGTNATNSPAYFGYNEESVSGYTNGGLVFATRSVTTDTAPTERLRISSTGHTTPGADAVYDLGISTKRWRNVYTTDLQLSNVGGGGNEVDGTEGTWTLQEGESDVYMINRKTGKKYKMMLQEVS